MKKDRFFIDNVVMGLLLLLAITVGIYFRVTVKDCGLVKVNHVDDIKPGMVTLEYAIDKDEYFGADGISNAINELEQAPVIAIAKATGNLNLTRGTYGQEIMIEKVIRGENEISQGDTAWIYQSYGLEEMDGKILFRNCLNIMKPATEYLVLFTSLTIESISERERVCVNASCAGLCTFRWGGNKAFTNVWYKGFCRANRL